MELAFSDYKKAFSYEDQLHKKMLEVGIEPTTTAYHSMYIQYLYKSDALPTELLERSS
jgi:hypothetical protein